MGLAISRKFVQLLGGELTVTSTLGQGSVFTFDIRAGAATSGAIPPERRSEGMLGVSGVPRPEIPPPAMLTPEALAAVPAELLTDLAWAAERSNMAQVFRLIEHIGAHNAAVADVLARLANNFEYDAILTLLRSCLKNKFSLLSPGGTACV